MEVEEAVLLHPAVAEVAVVWLPADVYGERAATLVITENACVLTLTDLLASMREHGLATRKSGRLYLDADSPRNSG